MPPKKRRPRPAGHGCTPFENIALSSNDGSDDSLENPFSQLRHRPIGPDEIPGSALCGGARPPLAIACLCRAFNACGEDEQGRFLVHIGWNTK